MREVFTQLRVWKFNKNVSDLSIAFWLVAKEIKRYYLQFAELILSNFFWVEKICPCVRHLTLRRVWLKKNALNSQKLDSLLNKIRKSLIWSRLVNRDPPFVAKTRSVVRTAKVKAENENNCQAQILMTKYPDRHKQASNISNSVRPNRLLRKDLRCSGRHI